MDTIEAIRNAVKRSPLKYIKGECRVPHLMPGEWLAWYKGHPFNPDDPLLIFIIGDSYIGKYIVQKETVEYCKFSVKDDLSMYFVLREDGEVSPLHIFIEMHSSFPELLKVAQFVAHTDYTDK